jgi:hypothetical protein
VCGDKSGYWTTYIWISSKYSQPRSQNWPEVGRNKYIYIYVHTNIILTSWSSECQPICPRYPYLRGSESKPCERVWRGMDKGHKGFFGHSRLARKKRGE